MPWAFTMYCNCALRGQLLKYVVDLIDMAPRLTRILFLLAVFSFLFLSTTLVFYAQGYYYDLENQRFIATGGLYLESLPGKARVVINGEVTGRTPRFIDGLSAGFYRIIISRDGRQLWEKSLPVKPGEVTETGKIHLPLSSPVKTLIANDKVEELIRSGGEEKRPSADEFQLRVGPLQELALVDQSNIVALSSSGELIAFNLDVQDFVVLQDKVVWFKLDPDKEKVFLWEKDSLLDDENRYLGRVIWLRDQRRPYRQPAGSSAIVLVASGLEAPKAEWFLKGSAIVVLAGSGIEIVEVDGRGGHQRWRFFTGEVFDDAMVVDEKLYASQGGEWFAVKIF